MRARPHALVPIVIAAAIVAGPPHAGIAATQGNACAQSDVGAHFKFIEASKKASASPVDSGIVPPGFVDLPGRSALHGIDVSKWQDQEDLQQVWACGGRFEFIRLSAGEDKNNELAFLDHWKQARQYGFHIGPYHSLTLFDSRGAAIRLSEDELAALIVKNQNSARVQADLFHKQLLLVTSFDVANGTLGGELVQGDAAKRSQNILPPTLVVDVKLQANYSASDRAVIGKVYQAAICTWLRAFRDDARFNDMPVQFSTTPSIFSDYGLAAAPCDLASLDVWVLQRPRDGGFNMQDDQTANDPNNSLRALCLRADGRNRCAFDQYTSYGGFGNFDRKSPLDLDRFHGTEKELEQREFKFPEN